MSDEPPLKRRRIDDRVIDRLQAFVRENPHNDVEFIVGRPNNQQTFHANKMLFAAQSEVFKTMLFDTAASNDAPITIMDVTPAAFDYLHQLFYARQPELSNDIVIDVLYAANKYMIDIVIDECKEAVMNNKRMDGIYTVLSSIGQYPGSNLFDQTIHELMQHPLLKENIGSFIGDNRFNQLKACIIVHVIRSDLFKSQIRKYECIKNYCVANAQNDDSLSWQSMFKDQFLDDFNLSDISRAYLLKVVKNDHVLSSDSMLDIISTKNNFGFRLSDILLNFEERKSLEIGDIVDLRDWKGAFFEAKVIKKNGQNIALKFEGYDVCKEMDINEGQWIAKHGSVTRRISVNRPCMKNKKSGDDVYVNYGCHPLYQHANKWRKCQLKQSSAVCFTLSPLSTGEQEYWIHPDSESEVACLDDKCEYCFR